MVIKEFFLPFKMTSKPPAFIRKLAGTKAEPELLIAINQWCKNKKKDPFEKDGVLQGQEHIGGLTKQMFLMMVDPQHWGRPGKTVVQNLLINQLIF